MFLLQEGETVSFCYFRKVDADCVNSTTCYRAYYSAMVDSLVISKSVTWNAWRMRCMAVASTFSDNSVKLSEFVPSNANVCKYIASTGTSVLMLS